MTAADPTHPKPRVVATIEARMSSSRLPGKVLKEVLGRPLLGYLLERLRRCETIDEIILATSTNPKDEPIARLCEAEGCRCYRGSEEDVLGRVAEAAALGRPDIWVEISGDCPLIDPEVVDRIVRAKLETGRQVVSNYLQRTYPAGMDCIVFDYELLRLSSEEATTARHREHVALYVLEHADRFTFGHVLAPPALDRPWLRLLVDYPEDYQVIRTVFEDLYPKDPRFGLADVIALVDRLGLDRINDHVWPKNVIGMPPRKGV